MPEREGSGPPVVLLHGWPGDRFDYREVMPPLSASADLVVPDLRGFGGSDKHPEDPARAYSAGAQTRSVARLLTELGLPAAVIAGYDIGTRVAQTLATTSPVLEDRARACSTWSRRSGRPFGIAMSLARVRCGVRTR